MFASVVLSKNSEFYLKFLESFIYDGYLSQNSQNPVTEKQNARKWRVIDFTDYAIFDIIVLVCLFIQKSLLQVSTGYFIFTRKQGYKVFYTPIFNV